MDWVVVFAWFSGFGWGAVSGASCGCGRVVGSGFRVWLVWFGFDLWAFRYEFGVVSACRFAPGLLVLWFRFEGLLIRFVKGWLILLSRRW